MHQLQAVAPVSMHACRPNALSVQRAWPCAALRCSAFSTAVAAGRRRPVFCRAQKQQQDQKTKTKWEVKQQPGSSSPRTSSKEVSLAVPECTCIHHSILVWWFVFTLKCTGDHHAPQWPAPLLPMSWPPLAVPPCDASILTSACYTLEPATQTSSKTGVHSMQRLTTSPGLCLGALGRWQGPWLHGCSRFWVGLAGSMVGVISCTRVCCRGAYVHQEKHKIS